MNKYVISVYPSVHPAIHLTNLLIYKSTYRSIYRSIYLSVYDISMIHGWNPIVVGQKNYLMSIPSWFITREPPNLLVHLVHPSYKLDKYSGLPHAITSSPVCLFVSFSGHIQYSNIIQYPKHMMLIFAYISRFIWSASPTKYHRYATVISLRATLVPRATRENVGRRRPSQAADWIAGALRHGSILRRTWNCCGRVLVVPPLAKLGFT